MKYTHLLIPTPPHSQRSPSGDGSVIESIDPRIPIAPAIGISLNEYLMYNVPSPLLFSAMFVYLFRSPLAIVKTVGTIACYIQSLVISSTLRTSDI